MPTADSPIHFRVNPCKPGDWGSQSAEPDEVTCPDCVPIAAKYRRGAALQAFEQAQVDHAAKAATLKRASAAAGAAHDEERAAWRAMDKARDRVLDLLKPVPGAP